MRCPDCNEKPGKPHLVGCQFAIPISYDPTPKVPPASSVDARLTILEDRVDEVMADLDMRMGSEERMRPAGGFDTHNLDALLLWTHPEAWNLGGSPEERLRMRTVLDQIHAAVKTAHRGERVETPEEVAARQRTEPPPTVVGT